jgi:putative sigma-54 modulation protein
MDIQVTFRHADHDEKLKDHAEKQIEKVSKFLYRPVEAQVIFSKEKARTIAEVSILADHNQFFARDQGEDFFLTLDQVMGKIESQIKKYHDRLKRSKGRKETEEAVGEGSATDIPEIIKGNEYFIKKPITVEEAADLVEKSESQFIVFRKAENEKLCIIYKRHDGNFGLIEPN